MTAHGKPAFPETDACFLKFAAFYARLSPSGRRKNNNIPGDGLNISVIGASATNVIVFCNR
jgi:hypothetical protein